MKCLIFLVNKRKLLYTSLKPQWNHQLLFLYLPLIKVKVQINCKEIIRITKDVWNKLKYFVVSDQRIFQIVQIIKVFVECHV